MPPDEGLNHEYMAQPGRLRRPGRGLKTEEVSQQPIHPTASHTEIRTPPTITDTAEKITEAGLKNSSAKIYPSGTLLMAMYAMLRPDSRSDAFFSMKS